MPKGVYVRNPETREKISRAHVEKHTAKLREVDGRWRVSKLLRQGATLKQIHQQTGLSIDRIKQYREESLKRVKDLPVDESVIEIPDGGWKAMSKSFASASAEAERARAFNLRMRALPYPDIARVLDVAEATVRQWVQDELERREREDFQDIGAHRRMELERLDAMMAAIMTPATGVTADGKKTQVVLEAMDRMLKLMDMRAKLLGLNAPQTVDINQRIEILALQYEYDVDELKDIARDVIQQRVKTKSLPVKMSP